MSGTITDLFASPKGEVIEVMPATSAGLSRKASSAKRAPLDPATGGASLARSRIRQSVVIVEKNLLFRAGLIHVLAKKQFHVIAQCAAIDDLPIHKLAIDPSLLLIGVESDLEDEVQGKIEDLRTACKGLRIVLFYDQMSAKISSMGAVVDALLPKQQIDPDLVLKTLEIVRLGASVCSRQLFQELLAEAPLGEAQGTPPVPPTEAGADLNRPGAGSRTKPHPAVGSLTAREQAILSHLMKGFSNKVIARELGIAEATVKIHVKNLLLKIDARNRTQAAMWGLKQQISIGASAEPDIAADRADTHCTSDRPAAAVIAVTPTRERSR